MFSYSRIAIALMALICIIRKTTDGLWFITLVVYSIASHFDRYQKEGSPVLYGKKKGQSVKDFGFLHAFFALAQPKYLLTKSENPYRNQSNKSRFVIKWDAVKAPVFKAVFWLHAYIGFMIFLDLINPGFVRSILSIINEPMLPLLHCWPSYESIYIKFITYGYQDRVPLLTHAFIVYVASIILYLWLMIPPSIGNDLEQRYRSNREFMKSMNRVVLQWMPIRFVLGCGIFGLSSIFIWSHLMTTVYFLGEPYPRNGKYIWIYSYPYIDNIAYFTPVYLSLFWVLILVAGGFLIYEPISMMYSYCKCFLDRKVNK